MQDRPKAAPQCPAPLRLRFLRSFSALVLREMSTSYGRSAGGYLWAILEPVAGVALLSIIFTFITHTPSLGTNFPYFFASGLLVFMLYTSVSTATAASIRFSRALLEYPAVSFMDALLARFLLNAVTQLLVMFIVLSGIVALFDLTPLLRWPSIFLAIAMALTLAFGVGAINCYLITSHPLWERIWAVLNRPLFIISGVMFIPEQIPWPAREILLINPLLHITSEMRKGLYGTYEGVHVSPLYVFGLALILTAFGLFLLSRHHKEIILK